MSRPLKTSQFAEIFFISEQVNPEDAENYREVEDAVLLKVGIATSLRVSENLGSTQRNVIGTPVGIPVPGFYQGNMTMEKATIDLKSFKTMSRLNPYVAFRPDTYADDIVPSWQSADSLKTLNIDVTNGLDQELFAFQNSIPRFMFGMYVYDTTLNGGLGGVSTPTGAYVAMLQNYDITLSSQDAIVMENITALCRPVRGSWFGAIQDVFNLNPGFGYLKGPSGRPQL